MPLKTDNAGKAGTNSLICFFDGIPKYNVLVRHWGRVSQLIVVRDKARPAAAIEWNLCWPWEQ